VLAGVAFPCRAGPVGALSLPVASAALRSLSPGPPRALVPRVVLLAGLSRGGAQPPLVGRGAFARLAILRDLLPLRAPWRAARAPGSARSPHHGRPSADRWGCWATPLVLLRRNGFHVVTAPLRTTPPFVAGEGAWVHSLVRPLAD